MEPKALSNITFKKPKVGENILDNNDDYVPSICETPLYTSDEEFKAEVRNSALFKLIDIKGTTVNTSFTCTPIARSIMQENHGEHVSLSSCRKCYNFYNSNIMLCTRKVKNLEQGTKSQSSSILWRDARKVRLTASSASKVTVEDTTDATIFIREHLHPTFTGSKFTRHGTEQNPLVKEHLRSLGNEIVDTGVYMFPTKSIGYQLVRMIF